MTALTKIVKGLARQVYLFNGERLNSDIRPSEKHFALTERVRSDLCLNDDREFQKSTSTDETAVRGMNQLGITYGLGFTKENRHQR